MDLTRRLALAATLAVAGACGGRGGEPFEPPPPGQPTWALNIVTVAQSTASRFAGANALTGGRDDLGTMHLLWEDGPVLRHGFVALDQAQWTLRTVPTLNASATVRRPVLGYPSGAVFLAAWLEQVGTTNRIVVSRSLDHGATWDAPITLAFGTGAFSSPVMYAYRRSSGTMGAVVAWSDPATPTPGRVVTTFWRGTGWTINDWSTVAPLSTNVTGSARQVALAGVGENVFAAWADPRGAPVGGTGVFISRSTNGGQSWQQDALIGIPVGTSAVGSDPAVALELDGDVYVAWSAADGVRVVRSPDNGLNFSAPRTLGPGFGPSIATGDDDRIAVAWTGVGGDAADEAQHFVSLALSYDDLVTIDTPTAMPGSASIRSRTQARAFLAGASLDMAWIDVTGGQRAVQHRTARLP